MTRRPTIPLAAAALLAASSAGEASAQAAHAHYDGYGRPVACDDVGCVDVRCPPARVSPRPVPHASAPQPYPAAYPAPGQYQAPAANGTYNGPAESVGIRGFGIRIPEIRIELPTVTLPTLFHTRRNAELVQDAVAAPYVVGAPPAVYGQLAPAGYQVPAPVVGISGPAASAVASPTAARTRLPDTGCDEQVGERPHAEPAVAPAPPPAPPLTGFDAVPLGATAPSSREIEMARLLERQQALIAEMQVSLRRANAALEATAARATPVTDRNGPAVRPAEYLSPGSPEPSTPAPIEVSPASTPLAPPRPLAGPGTPLDLGGDAGLYRWSDPLR